MEISRSIFGLAKSNNGFFKSEKQAQFLISQIESFGGLIGHANSGYNSCPIFASFDDKGITKIVKSSKNGDVVMFERKEEGVLTTSEIKEIKRLERKLKLLQKEIDEGQSSFNDGSYNGSGDVLTYTPDMVKRFEKFQNIKINQVKKLKSNLCELKK